MTQQIKKGITKVMSFSNIFKDNNEFNEKNIVGFISFAVMVIVILTDVVTSLIGHEFAISESIYNSFLIITLGSFGIDGLTKVFSNNKPNFDNEDEPTEPTE